MATEAARAERLDDFTTDAWLSIDRDGNVVDVVVDECLANCYADSTPEPIEVRKVRLKMAG